MKWKNAKKVLPTVDATVIVKHGKFMYTICQLTTFDDSDEIVFLPWSDQDAGEIGTIPIEEVEQWAYVKLPKENE